MGQSVPKIVNVIIPMILNKLGNQSKATLITFENSSQVYSGDADYFSKLNLYAEGGTYMGKALEQLENILNNLEEGISIRILAFSDGDLHDQERTMELSSKISQKFKGKFKINAQAIRYYTSSWGEPDTRGLSSILQLNSINTTPKLEDINYDVEVNLISDKICDYFINDGLDLWECGLHGFKFIGYFHAPDVTCMPYLIAFAQIVFVFFIPTAMCIADDTNSFHSNTPFCLFVFSVGILKRFLMNCAMKAVVSSIPRMVEFMQRS